MSDRRPPPARRSANRPMPLSPSIWTPQEDEETAAAAVAPQDDSYHGASNDGEHLNDSLLRQDDDNDDNVDEDDEEYSPLPVAVVGGSKKARESPAPFPSMALWNDEAHDVGVTTPGRRGGGNHPGLHHRHIAAAVFTAAPDAASAASVAPVSTSVVGETIALHVTHSPNTVSLTTIAATVGTTSPLRQRRLVGTADTSPYRLKQNHHIGGSAAGVMQTSSSSLYKHQQHQHQQQGWWRKNMLHQHPTCLQFLFKTKARRNGIISLGLLFYFGGLWQMHQQASSSTSSYLDDALRSTTRRPYDYLRSLQSNQYSYWRSGRREGGANDHHVDDDVLQPSSWLLAEEYGGFFATRHQQQSSSSSAHEARIQTRRLERQARTRPPRNSNTASFSLLLQSPKPPPSLQQQQLQPPPLHVVASVQDLCGIHAKRAFSSSSTQSASAFYGLRDALSRNRTSSSSSLRDGVNKNNNHTLYKDVEIRVVLTGNALSHPIGWLLALQLQQSCGVNVVAIVDPLQPATRMHRLQHYAQRVMLLQNRIPELQVLESLIGWQGDLSVLDKTAMQWKHQHHSKKRIPTWPRLVQTTGDVNLVAQWRPTHVVHFSAPSPSTTYNHGDENDSSESWLLSNAFQIQSSLASLEQVLASVAATTPHTRRPHVIFATTTTSNSVVVEGDMMKRHARRSLTDHLADMQVILAMAYHDRYQVQSVHVQLPNAMLGPHSTLEQLFHQSSSSSTASAAAMDAAQQQLDVVYATDVAQAMIAAMQFRSVQPATFALGRTIASDTTARTEDRSSVVFNTPDLMKLHVSLVAATNSTGPVTSRGLAATTTRRYNEEATTKTSSYLGWSPQTSVEETLLRTHAWSLDYKRQEAQNQWMILPSAAAQQAHKNQTGDEFLKRHAVNTCAANDWACHASPQFMPCASECSYREQCTSSSLDGDLASVSKESSEGCDIVLYTQHWGSHVKDLALKSEYMEDGNPLICNYAFVSRDSGLVKSVIDKVPDTELERFGVVMSVHDSKASIQEQKLEKLNGRLLYRGWILLWTSTNRTISNTDSSLLKLSPGRFFAEQVKFALSIEHTLPVAPTSRDIRYLVNQMHRDPLPTRAQKTKKPEAKYKLPPEPERRAIILMPQLRMQDSKKSKARDIPSDVSRKLSIKMAAKYMRYEQSVRRESSGMKRQREFYDALLKLINGASKDFLHPPDEPVYRITFADYWVRTRWVLHDLKLPESRQLRCEWFQEHLQWSSSADSSSLDQLSFAAVMAKRELQRRTLLQEPDDLVLHKLSSLIDTKTKLTDAFEWHPAYFPSADNNTRQDFDTQSLYKLNRLAYHSFDVLPPDKKRNTGGRRPALYVRIISDRAMSWARKTWNR